MLNMMHCHANVRLFLAFLAIDYKNLNKTNNL